MSIFRYLFAITCLISSPLRAEGVDIIPEPYRSICDLPFDDKGWFNNACPLQRLLEIKPAKIVIEVGCWLGMATRFIATTIPEDGILYAVDQWNPYQKSGKLSNLYLLFLSNIKHANLCHKVIPFRMDSKEGPTVLNVKADLIYIDAYDSPGVYDELMAWYNHLNADGIMCGDDWSNDSVQAGVIKAANELNRKFSHQGNCWWFE